MTNLNLALMFCELWCSSASTSVTSIFASRGLFHLDVTRREFEMSVNMLS